ncbi:MAG: hypothetical protein KME64_04010 [Scytonematopsis contorta HA4267-MV1]|jgi:acetylornithine deacetylase/succinyl-diaminopimelate desuccinylase-like protein|nr:hypothetical protein [Scytonematopsis contorta HA4267-MV1]
MSETATLVPIDTVISMLTAISARNWTQFKELEAEFVDQYGIEVWEDVFNFRVKPALDKDSDRWLLIQWCSAGIKSVKVVA